MRSLADRCPVPHCSESVNFSRLGVRSTSTVVYGHRMRNVTQRSLAGIAAAGLSLAVVATGVTEVSAAPQSRITPGQCGTTASSHVDQNGYVVNDPATNTSCTTNPNGTFLWVGGTTIRKHRWTHVMARLIGTTRGDVRAFAIVRFVRGKTVITRRVPLKRGGMIDLSQKLNRKGRWAVVVKYRSNRLSATINVV